MTVTTNWTGAFNGLAFGAGTPVQLVDLIGFRSMPALRTGDVPKASQDGNYPGLDFLDERIFTLDLLAFNPTVAFETVVASIATAFQSIQDPANALPFEFLLPGWATSRIVTCRPTHLDIDINSDFQYNKSTIPIEMTAADPLAYGSTLHTVTAGLPSPTAGLTFNVTFNATFGASTGGSMVVTNAGNYVTAPVFTITGPMTNPRIVFTATGAFIALNISLGAGDVLVVDMGARTVLLNGTAYRFNTIVTGSSWWGFPPGTWSIGVQSSDSAPVTGNFTATWRDAWGAF